MHERKDPERLLEEVFQSIEDSDMDEEQEQRLREDATEAYKQVEAVESDGWYTSFLSQYLATEHMKADGGNGDEERDETEETREKPLCRCESPTCWLKRGRVPPDIRDQSNGLLRRSTPQERTREIIDSHSADPVVLREAHQEAIEQKREGRADLRAANAESNVEQMQSLSDLR